ncbi:MAG: Kazal-type serine protease inhibitor family protein [Parvularculaceae bacterium]
MKTSFAAICGATFLLALGACAANTTEGDQGDSAPAAGQSGGMCGGIAAFACEAEGEYCAYKPGECVEIADAAGVCRERPGVCTMEYAPVCGCDGQTYSNACRAAASSVSVAHEGECPPPKEQN